MTRQPMPQPTPEPARIGATHAGGMLRMGFDELGSAAKAFPDSLPQADDPGLVFNALPQEIFQSRHLTGVSMQQSLAEPEKFLDWDMEM